jgi:bifunctional non-homologous end joining protein LigD
VDGVSGAHTPSIGELEPMRLDERKRAPSDESGWVAEIKYDGYRSLAQFGDGECRLTTRNGVDCTAWFPEVAEALGVLQLGGRTIVDGEIAVLDAVGRTDFEALQGRARRRRWRAGDVAVTYCVFDLLVVDGASIMGECLVERKARLAQLLSAEVPYILFARHADNSIVEQPVSWLYAQAVALELEGVVGKRADSPYVPGERTKNWFKLKRPGAVPPERFKHKWR